MTLKPHVIAEMRQLFKSGATPSRLMRIVVSHHEQDPELDRLIRAYFREAFGIPMFKASARLLDTDYEQRTFAQANPGLLHRMIQMRHEWDPDSQSDADTDANWMDPLSATNDTQRIQQSQPETWPEFGDVWDLLTEKAKQYIQLTTRNAHLLHEEVRILSALAEQLQQRINTLKIEHGIRLESEPPVVCSISE